MDKTIDRRAARTRRALHQALTALILRKGYDALTVQDIIDEADVGRSTFYAHFTGKEDLLRDGFADLRADLMARRKAASKQGAPSREPLSFSLALFEHACGYKQVYGALVGGKGGAVAINEIRRVLSEVVKEELAQGWKDDALPRDLALQFVVGAVVTVLGWLLARQPKVTPAQADAMFRRLVMRGIGPSIAVEMRGTDATATEIGTPSFLRR